MKRINKYIILSVIFSKCNAIRSVTSFKSVPPPSATPSVNKFPDLSQGTTYQCVSLADASQCEGYNDFYVPPTGYFTSASGFDSYVNTDVVGNRSFMDAACTNQNVEHDYEKIAYKHSIYCGRYMYSQVRWCTENSDAVRSKPELMLCKSTCEDFAYSVTDYGKNVCKNTDNSVAEKITQNILNNWCVLFSNEEGCIKGVSSEADQCGYSSAQLSAEAVTFNPSNSCWGSPEKIEEIKKIAKEQVIVKKKDIRKNFLAIPAVMVLIGALTFLAWRKQNNKYKNEYDIEKIPGTTEEDVYYPPSKAAPSRDYLSQSSSSNLKAPEIAAKRNSSFAIKNTVGVSGASSAAQAIANSKPGKRVVYMVAIYNYNATMEDELNLKKGDRIRVEHQYDDGWGAGINETTKKFGAFPLICCSSNTSSTSSKGDFPARNASQRLRSRGTIQKNTSPLSDDTNANLKNENENNVNEGETTNDDKTNQAQKSEKFE